MNSIEACIRNAARVAVVNARPVVCSSVPVVLYSLHHIKLKRTFVWSDWTPAEPAHRCWSGGISQRTRFPMLPIRLPACPGVPAPAGQGLPPPPQAAVPAVAAPEAAARPSYCPCHLPLAAQLQPGSRFEPACPSMQPRCSPAAGPAAGAAAARGRGLRPTQRGSAVGPACKQAWGVVNPVDRQRHFRLGAGVL